MDLKGRTPPFRRLTCSCGSPFQSTSWQFCSIISEGWEIERNKPTRMGDQRDLFFKKRTGERGSQRDPHVRRFRYPLMILGSRFRRQVVRTLNGRRKSHGVSEGRFFVELLEVLAHFGLPLSSPGFFGLSESHCQSPGQHARDGKPCHLGGARESVIWHTLDGNLVLMTGSTTTSSGSSGTSHVPPCWGSPSC